MASYFIAPGIPEQFHISGEPAANYILRAFLKGTSTATKIYSDNAGTEAGTTITLDSEGWVDTSGTRHSIWLDVSLEYDLDLRDPSNNTTVKSWPNISARLLLTNDGYTNFGDVPTFVSFTGGLLTFTVPGDQTTNYPVNRWMKISGTGFSNARGAVASVAYVSVTTITAYIESGVTPDATINQILVGDPIDQSIDHTHVAYQVLSNEVISGSVVVTDVEYDYGNVKRFGAVGDGSTDDTTAIQNAINAGGANSLIYFPSGTYKVTSTLTVANHRVYIVGDGPYATQILFAPTANDTCLQINTTGSVLFQGGMTGICFYSNDSTYTKIAVDLVDVSGWTLDDIVIGGSVVAGSSSFWSGANSTGLQVRGREFSQIRKLYCYADKPIVIADNPNNTIDIDHFHFTDTYLGANGNPNVTINDGINLTQVTFDGHNPWVLGTDGLYWVDTTTSASSNGLTLRGVRTEQGSNSASYALRIEHNSALQNLTMTDCYFGSDRNGFYLRKVTEVSWADSYYIGGAGKTSIDADATVKRMEWRNMFWQTGSSTTLAGQRQIFASPRTNGGALPFDAIYDESANTQRSVVIGGSISEESITLANDGVAELAPDGAAGIIMITDSEGLAGIYILRDGSPNQTYEVSDPVGVYSITAATASNTNIYWSAGNSRYEIENKRGGSRNYKISLLGSYTTF